MQINLNEKSRVKNITHNEVEAVNYFNNINFNIYIIDNVGMFSNITKLQKIFINITKFYFLFIIDRDKHRSLSIILTIDVSI